jgi:malonyl CoA-acyl carrier protein transacylase
VRTARSHTGVCRAPRHDCNALSGRQAHSAPALRAHVRTQARGAGPKGKLDSTAVSQPAIYVASLAALEKLKKDAPDVVGACDVAAGLSLGEYTALTFAGALAFEDGLKLVRRCSSAAALHVLNAGGECETLDTSAEHTQRLPSAISLHYLVRLTFKLVLCIARE